ncbi:MAG: glycosyltransferase family A protein [Candidatus Bathyarchaeia archaeon]
MHSRKSPKVSVIIPTFNSGKFLGKCLNSIRNQNYEGDIEVIVVDDGSTDNTIQIAREYDCRVLKNPKRGRAEAKNEGIRHSTGDYLFFVDSDMELTPNIVGECVRLLECNEKIGGVIIHEHSVGDSFWVKVRNFEKSFYTGTLIESARFFPAWLVKEVGGFEEGLIFYEESTLPFKISKKGYDVSARIKSVIIHHEEDFSLFTWLKKKFTYGKTLQKYERKFRDHSKTQSSIRERAGVFLNEWKRFWRNPLLALGVVFLKSMEYLAIFLGSVYSRVT